MESEFAIEKVQEKIQECLNTGETAAAQYEECKIVYLAELMDWTDYYTENCSTDPTSQESVTMLDSILKLWSLYSKFEASSGVPSNLEEAFEKASGDSLVGGFGQVYITFAELFLTVGNVVSAEKAFIQGLTKGLIQGQSDLLWSSYLQFAQSAYNSPHFTMEELFQSTMTKIPAGSSLSTPSNATQPLVEGKFASTGFGQMQFDAAESKVDENEAPLLPQQFSSLTNPPTFSSMMPSNIIWSDDLSSQAEYPSADQFLQTFHTRPNMLFVHPSQEPLLSGLQNLSPSELQELEAFIGTPLISLPSLFELDQPDSMLHLSQILDILESLWFSQALKERHFDAWFSTLQEQHKREQQSLSARGGHVNVQDIINIQQRHDAQRKLLTAHVNKTMYDLLLEQESVLTALRFPRFSAVFLQQLQLAGKDSSSVSFADTVMTNEIARQQRLVCALLSLRNQYLTPTTVTAPVGGNANLPMQATATREFQTRQMSISAESDFSSEDMSPGGSKKKAKRRRSVAAAGGQPQQQQLAQQFLAAGAPSYYGPQS